MNLPFFKKKGVHWHGDFPSWEEAVRHCRNAGYEESNILERTLQSTLKVKNGEAVFERDSFLFDKIQYSFPLLACLLKVAAECGGRLSVLDFGGALGSHYFQNRDFLHPVAIEKWTVVEQAHYVKAGNEFIREEGDPLDFAYAIEDVKDMNLLLSSCTLPYLPDPWAFARRFVNSGAPFILLDRMPIYSGARDRLTVEIVPPQIYDARYPCWFFNEEKLLAPFKEKYDLILDFENTIDHADIPSVYKGYLFRRK